MNNKIEAALATMALVLAFVIGRYSVSQKPDTKTTEIKQTQTQTQEQKDIHIVTKTVTRKDPTGAVTTTTVTTADTVVDKTRDSVVEDKKVDETHSQARSKINISALVAEDLHNPGLPAYGVSFQKEFIGPVTIGAFGLTSGVVGVSIGLNF
jgi:hypothetical protein